MKTSRWDSRPPRWPEAIVRASWAWGAFLGAALVIRYLFDTFVPPTDFTMRAMIMTYTVFAVCLLTGGNAAWRGMSMRAGVLISMSAATIGALISILGTGVMVAIWHDPATLDAWRRSGGLDEAFIDVPLKIVAIGAIFGSAGALAGRGMSVAFRSR